MKVSFITMQFPNPREAFASSEIRGFQNHLDAVSVHSFRFKHKDNLKLVKERDLQGAHLSWLSYNSLLKFPFHILVHFRIFVFAFVLLLKNVRLESKQGFRSFILLPRALEIYHEICTFNPSVVHTFWSHIPCLVSLMLKRGRKNTLVSMSLAAYDLNKNHWLTNLFIPQSDYRFTITADNIKKIETQFGKDNAFSVMHRGTDPQYFNWQYPEKKPFSIITAGALVERKGMENCIEVFKEIKKTYKSSSIKILGDGPIKPKLERLAEDVEGVQFLGHCSHARVFREMQEAEVFLFLSEFEHIPNVVKEAMASRCYCIVTNTDGIQELVQKRFGKIVPIKDAKAAYQALLDVFDQRSIMEHKTKDAIIHLDDKFNSEKNIQTHLKEWKKLLNQ